VEIDRRWFAALIVLLIVVFIGGTKYQEYHDIKEAENTLAVENIFSEMESIEEADPPEVEVLIKVYVCGEVKNPGIYTVSEGARLHEVMERAIPLESAELKYIGMAREVLDGETIIVPAVGDEENINVNQQTGTVYQTAVNGKVNINRASAADMANRLSGIGSVISQRIVDYREANGPFQSIEEIKNVSGIGDKKFDDIKNSICIK